MWFRVCGCDRKTAQDSGPYFVDAPDEESALQDAVRLGMLVSSIGPVAPEATLIGDYCLQAEGRFLHIDGPDESISGAIAKQYLAALPSDELRDIVVSGYADRLRAEAFGGHHRGLKGPATERQLAYATGLGLSYPANPTKAYIGRMLDQFEQTRFYVYFVWRCLTGGTPSECGQQTEPINAFVVRLMQQDPPIVIRVLLAQALANFQGTKPSRTSGLFQEMADRVNKHFRPIPKHR